jgi:hypothetical protein
LPVPHVYRHILLCPLQNGHVLPFLRGEAPEGLRGILTKGFDPACDASPLPEQGTGGSFLTAWRCSQIVWLVIGSADRCCHDASGSLLTEWTLYMSDQEMSIKDVTRLMEADEKTVRRWIKNRELHATKDIFGRYQIFPSDFDALREQRRRRYNPDDED